MGGSERSWDWGSMRILSESRKCLDFNSLFFPPRIAPLYVEWVLNHYRLGSLPPSFSRVDTWATRSHGIVVLGGQSQRHRPLRSFTSMALGPGNGGGG